MDIYKPLNWTHNQSQAQASHLDRSQLSNKDRPKGLAETKSNRRHNLARKEHQDGGDEVLKNDAADTNNTSNDNGLLSADEVAHNSGRKGRAENTDRVGSIEDLLVVRRDDILLAGLVTELLREGCHGEELAHHRDFIAEVDGD